MEIPVIAQRKKVTIEELREMEMRSVSPVKVFQVEVGKGIPIIAIESSAIQIDDDDAIAEEG